MKKETQNIGVTIGQGIRSFFIAIWQLLEAFWSFIVNNISRILKILLWVWILVLGSILTLALAYWLLGLGSKHFIEAGEKLETLDMEKIINKYPNIQKMLEEVEDDE